MKKRHLCGALWCLLGGVLLWGGLSVDRGSVPAFSPAASAPVTVIVDPGHGGEDGGALAPDGTVESALNLEIALRVESLLRFAGVRTDMTRREDVSIHAPEARTLREKKTSDLKNRVERVDAAENALLLSIHQNSLPASPETWGAQTFYNESAGAEVLAAAVQEALNQSINTHRAKEARPIGSGVYLMNKIHAPGLLVECGFLSNPEETERLQHADHQKTIACAIAAGLLRGMAGEDIP